MSRYLEEVQKGMDYLASKPETIFVGQAVEYKGTAVTHQVKDYPKEKLLEMPVAEDFQAGFCLGLTLQGYIPVCIYPRMDFAICAANQIVNHIDKWGLMHPDNNPHIIIKTVVGSKEPLDPGHQHKSDHGKAFSMLTKTIRVFPLSETELYNPPSPNWHKGVFPVYEHCANIPGVYMIVEYGDLYK